MRGQPGEMSKVSVRASEPSDFSYAEVAAELILRASQDFQIAARSPYMLMEKITAGHAALALEGEELIGFGYIAAWKDNTVSHSGMVVREDHRGTGLFVKLKEVLMDIANREYPESDVISLTASDAVRKVNAGLGYQFVPLSELSKDPEFWNGCRGCKDYETVNSSDSTAELNPFGMRCCCRGMRLVRNE